MCIKAQNARLCFCTKQEVDKHLRAFFGLCVKRHGQKVGVSNGAAFELVAHRAGREALGSDFEARIAGIDAALIQPSLTSQRRLELWRDRVSALRAYASFESTQRALAASGERYDAMLVSID